MNFDTTELSANGQSVNLARARQFVAAISRTDSEIVTSADLGQKIAAVRADLGVLRSDGEAEISTTIPTRRSLDGLTRLDEQELSQTEGFSRLG